MTRTANPAKITRKPKVWPSVARFRTDLTNEHEAEDSPPVHNDDTPRIALREPIWTTLRQNGPMTAATLRSLVLSAQGLNPKSSRLVNYHAWALVDLQRNGYVEAYSQIVGSKNGLKRVKLYRGVKPRARITANGVEPIKPEPVRRRRKPVIKPVSPISPVIPPLEPITPTKEEIQELRETAQLNNDYAVTLEDRITDLESTIRNFLERRPVIGEAAATFTADDARKHDARKLSRKKVNRPSLRANLSPETIEDIRAFAAEGYTYDTLADVYDVSRSTIGNIVGFKGCYA